jgi:hypothetical protein
VLAPADRRCARQPGSTRERDLFKAWSRMAGQLLKHSDKPHLAALLPEELREAHTPQNVLRDDAPAQRTADAVASGAHSGRKRTRLAAAAASVSARAAKKPTLDALPSLAAAKTLWDEELLEDAGALVEGDDDEALLEGAGFF